MFNIFSWMDGLTAKVRAHGSPPWSWVLFSFGQLALHFLLTWFGVKKCLENHAAVHVQHISRRCAQQGTKPLMHINMTHWPVWPTNKKSFLPFLSVYARPKTAQSSMIFWKSAIAKPKLTKKKKHNPTVAPPLGPHHFYLGSRTCVSPTHNHIPNFMKALQRNDFLHGWLIAPLCWVFWLSHHPSRFSCRCFYFHFLHGHWLHV